MFARFTITIVSFALLAFGSPGHTHTAWQNDLPKAIEAKAPVYPAIAFGAHATGKVSLEVEIDSNGRVLDSRRISGHPLLVAVSRNAALSWRFEASSQTMRKVILEFDFDADASKCHPVRAIAPYHLAIAPTPPPETVSYIRDDGKADCEVHRTRLLRDRVEIIYGLVDQRKGYQLAAEKLFPNANSEILGGCLVDTETCDGVERQWSPKYAEVLYCAKCRRAQQEWVKKHQLKQSSLRESHGQEGGLAPAD